MDYIQKFPDYLQEELDDFGVTYFDDHFKAEYYSPFFKDEEERTFDTVKVTDWSEYRGIFKSCGW
jgi:hypothetical protein